MSFYLPPERRSALQQESATNSVGNNDIQTFRRLTRRTPLRVLRAFHETHELPKITLPTFITGVGLILGLSVGAVMGVQSDVLGWDLLFGGFMGGGGGLMVGLTANLLGYGQRQNES